MKPTKGKCGACGAEVLHVLDRSRSGSPFVKLSTRVVDVATLPESTGTELHVLEDGPHLEHRCPRARPKRDPLAEPSRDGLDVAECSRCRAAIVWITTTNAKPAPCNAESTTGLVLEPAEARAMKGKPELVRGFTAAGEAVAITTGELPDLFGRERARVYVSHFATCPAAQHFRRRRTR